MIPPRLVSATRTTLVLCGALLFLFASSLLILGLLEANGVPIWGSSILMLIYGLVVGMVASRLFIRLTRRRR
jgi:hypothetical protein